MNRDTLINYTKIGGLYILIYFILFIVYNVILENGHLESENIICAVFSNIIFLYGLLNLFQHGIKVYSAFLSFFYFGLSINCLYLSNLQEYRSIDDLHYLFVGPLIFSLVVWLFEKISINKIKIKKIIKIDYMADFLFFVSLTLQLYIYSQKGIKLLDGDFFSANNDAYTVENISGICDMMKIMLLLLIADVSRKRKIVYSIYVMLFSAILNVHRSEFVRYSLYFVILYAYIYWKKLVVSKYLINRIIILSFSFIFIFGALGTFRQYQVDDFNFSSVKMADLKIDNEALGWFYGYYPINYSVVKTYYDVKPLREMTQVNAFFERLMGDKQKAKEVGIMYGEDSSFMLNGFNAPTFLSGFILDFGYFYFVEIFVFSILIGMVILLLRCTEAKGAYAYMITIVTLFIFSNDFISAERMLAIILMAVIYPFLYNAEYK